MKRKQYIPRPAALAAALLLAGVLPSCSLEGTSDRLPDLPITFTAFTENLTRAEAITSGGTGGTALGDIRVFAVSPGSLVNANHQVYDAHFYDTFKESNGEYVSDNPYYWPKHQDYVRFMAFNGYKAETGKAYGSTVLGGEVHIELPYNDGPNNTNYVQAKMPGVHDITIPMKASGQFDLMIAKTSGVNTDPASFDHSRPSALNFRHTMSRIRVLAVNDAPNITVTVLGCRIVKVKDRADLYFPKGYTDQNNNGAGNNFLVRDEIWANYEESGATPLFTALAAEVSGAVQVSHDAAKPTDIVLGGGGDSFMLLPQQATGWDGTSTAPAGAYISVLCRITQKDGTASGTYQLFPSALTAGNAGKYAYTAVPVTTDWHPGRTYTYTLKFFDSATGGGGGLTDPIAHVAEAEDKISGSIVAPPSAVTDVVGGPLSFTLNVSGWGNADYGVDLTDPNTP